MSGVQIPIEVYADTVQIRFLVDRQHVSASGVDIVRDLRRRMPSDKWSKRIRKMVYRYALKCHAENRNLYRNATRGGA